MDFQYKLLTKKNRATTNIDNAMWLLFGTDLTVEPREIGNIDKSISDVHLRSLMDTVVYKRYAHELTTPLRHIYAWVDVNEAEIQNAGAEEVSTKDGFKAYMQISLYSGVKSLSKFQADPDFPDGPRLRTMKHARIKVILQDMEQGAWCHKVYIAHKRNYIHEGMFLSQMELVLNGEMEEALKIRNDKIAKNATNRKTAYVIREAKGNGESDDVHPNWKQVQEQLAVIEEAKEKSNGDGEPAVVDARQLIIKDYRTGTEVNMFTLPANRYNIRRNKTPGTWDWDPTSEERIKDWLIMRNNCYTIDLEADA